MKRKVLFLLFSFFVGILGVSAKEVNFYFHPNGGNVTTSGFSLSDYGYLSYNGYYYASYTDKDTIKTINSIEGQKFSVTSSDSLVSGREWYMKNLNDEKNYFFSESSSYNVSQILKILGMEDDEFVSIDLYANWSKKKIKGVDMTTSVGNVKAKSISITSGRNEVGVGSTISLSVSYNPTNAPKQTITWKSSNTKIATVDKNGKVKGVKAGNVTITATSSGGLKATKAIRVTAQAHVVKIQYHKNYGGLLKEHGTGISLKDGYISVNGSIDVQTIPYGSSLGSDGLVNYNNPKYVNLVREGYTALSGQEWNTKRDGTGKSYSQSSRYKASDFCDASKADCTITLYTNWKAKHSVKIRYSINQGSLQSNHGANISVRSGYVIINGAIDLHTLSYGTSINQYGLVDYNNPNYVNLGRNGYTIPKGQEWNTKRDGTGKSFSQEKVYKASDFCDASKGDCTVTLYANWKKLPADALWSLGTINLGNELFREPTIYDNQTKLALGQGFTMAKGYYVTCIKDKEDTVAAIAIYNKNHKLVRRTIVRNKLSHCNDLTYNPTTDEIIVPEYNYKDGAIRKFSFSKALNGNISVSTKVLYNKSGEISHSSGVAYDPSNGYTYVAKGGWIAVHDKNMKMVSAFKKRRTDIPQGIGSYKGYILVVRFQGSQSASGGVTTSKNCIDIYRNDGEYVGTYIINNAGELESLAWTGNGNKFALFFCNGKVFEVNLNIPK